MAIPATLEYSTFNNLSNIRPKTIESTWDDLVTALSTNRRIEGKSDDDGKEGALFSGAVYAPGKTRGLENTTAVSMFLVDVDCGLPPETFTKSWDALGLAYVVYSSHRSKPDKPKWRAVFPFTEPFKMEGNEDGWYELWADLGRNLFGGYLDPSCKDPCRAMYLPSSSEETAPHAFAIVANEPHRQALDPYAPEAYIADGIPVKPLETKQRDIPAVRTDLDPKIPAHDYCAKTDFAKLLDRYGWVLERTDNRGESYWIRPGKKRGRNKHGGTLNFKGSGLFYCLTSSIPELEAWRAYNQAQFLCAMTIGNPDNDANWKELNRKLGADGYGEPSKPRNERHALLEPAINLDKPPVAGIETEEPKPQKQKATLVPIYTGPQWFSDIANIGEGVRTGYPSLDKYTLLQRGSINIAAGRPAHGKTTFLVNVTRNLLERGERVIYFNYEDGRARLMTRLVMSIAQVNIANDPATLQGNYFRAIRGLDVDNPAEIERIHEARDQVVKWLESGQLLVSDTPFKAEDLAVQIELARGAKYENVMLDYIQKVRAEQTFGNRQQHVQHVSEILREAVDNSSTMLLTGAQFNRSSVDEKKDATADPCLHHLRECGDLEQDAALVIGINNTMVAAKQSDPNSDPFQASDRDAIPFRAKLLKARNGAAGEVAVLGLVGKFYRIEDKPTVEDSSDTKTWVKPQ